MSNFNPMDGGGGIYYNYLLHYAFKTIRTDKSGLNIELFLNIETKLH